MSKFDELICKKCGGELQLNDEGKYKCSYCGRTYEKKAEDNFAEKLRNILNEDKYERLSSARRNLWDAMHEKYVNTESCIYYARELKSLIPSDYYANFAETANGKSEEEISKFLNKSSKEDMDVHADAVLDFMIKSMTPGDLTAVCNYIDRAYPKGSPEYARYINLYEEEVEKVEDGIYELTMPRDVFVAYSSKDIEKVLELTDYLEEQGISCFISMRNLRHGRGAADNYDKALQTAIDNCKTVIFVSSKNSRNLACDALRKEIPYIRKIDKENVPAEYKNLPYDKIPREYKKPRIQYIVDEPTGTVADNTVREFFSGDTWCESKEKVASYIVDYLTRIPSVKSETKSGTEDGTASSASDRIDKKKILETKEKNVLEHVGKLVEMGNFNEAVKNLSELEKEEIAERGNAGAGVYYYKILAKNKTKNFKEIVKTVTQSGNTLKCDSDYLFALESPDDPYKEKIIEIENRIEEINAQTEREAKEKAEKERQRREQEKLDEEERKRRYAEAEKELERLRVKKFTDVWIAIIVSLSAVILTGVILGFALKNMSGGITSIIAAFLVFITLIVISIIAPTKKGTNKSDNTKIAKTIIAVPAKRKTIGISLLFILLTGAIVSTVMFMPYKSLTDELGITYSVSTNYCYVSSYDGDSEEIVIPSEYEGRQVIGIKANAFMDNETITTVAIPDTVRWIHQSAFEACSSLVTVNMSGSVKTIGEDAFLHCSSLESIDLTGVEKIGVDSFSACSNLSEVTFSEGLKRISKHAFMSSRSLTEITIPSSVKYIGKDAFSGCKLTSVYFVDPTGWKCGGEAVDSDALSDPSSAATLLLDGIDDKVRAWKH